MHEPTRISVYNCQWDRYRPIFEEQTHEWLYGLVLGVRRYLLWAL